MLTIKAHTQFSILSVITTFFPCISAQNYLAIDWSQRTYGPDGPWNAVSVQVGGMQNSTPIKLQQVQVDLYPGSTWSTFIPTNVSCDPATQSSCGQGTTWIPSLDHGPQASFEWNISVDYQPTFIYNNTQTYIQGSIVPQAITMGGQTIYAADLVSVDSDDDYEGGVNSVTYPNGVTAFPQLGLLALYSGPNNKDVNQTFPESATNNSAGSAMVQIPAGYLFSQNIIPSYSYGLHIGAAALNYTGSLYLGGYDKARVIGPYTILGSKLPTLLDIGIGVETGGSPFSFQNKSGLLLLDNDDDNISIDIVPHAPSLYLPAKTCEGLATILPIYFDQVTKYYLWNTSDPTYKQVVTSPAYLSFTFPPAPVASNNVTIKIPFALLNLTLSSPIVSTPVQYFPCQVVSNTNNGYEYALGRAFLQGAFVGWNTNANIGWLAQAPGPGDSNIGLGGPEGQSIANDATQLDVYDGTTTNYFAQSWAKHWTPLPSQATPSPAAPTSAKHSKAISSGAIAGIAVGAAVAVIALVSGLFLCMRRRRKREAAKEIPLNDRSESPKTDDVLIDSPSRLLTPPPPFTPGPNELHQGQFYQVAEMPSNRDVQELHSDARAVPVRPGRIAQHDVHELGLPPTPSA
ncbi:hypothetical protein KCU78_g4049, partial [Aureobasidium melanogenum]